MVAGDLSPYRSAHCRKSWMWLVMACPPRVVTVGTKNWYKIGLDGTAGGGVQYEYQASHYRRKQNEHQHRHRPEDQAPARHGWLVRLLFPQQHVRHPQGRPRNVDRPPSGRLPRERHRRDLDRLQPRRGPRAHRLADLTAPRAGPKPRPLPQGSARSGLTIL